MKSRILVSACLLGINCKYTGDNNYNQQLIEDLAKQDLEAVIPVCPEQLGGLTTPRHPVEIIGGSGIDVLNQSARTLNDHKEDVTSPFIKGAEETLKIARLTNCDCAILKERSPSCGVNLIYDGTFSHNTLPGEGVCTAILRKHGFEVFSEEDYPFKSRR